VQTTVCNSRSSLVSNAVALALSQTGLDVTVGAGAFTIASQSYVFEEHSYSHVVTPAACSLVGYLVVVIATGEVHLFVDDIPAGGTAYDFYGSPYQLLHLLFTALVPGGATSLDDVLCTLYHITEEG